MPKIILTRKPKLMFTGPNTEINKFRLVEKRRFWFDKVMVESKYVSDVIEYACKNKIPFVNKIGNEGRVKHEIYLACFKRGLNMGAFDYYGLIKN